MSESNTTQYNTHYVSQFISTRTISFFLYHIFMHVCIMQATFQIVLPPYYSSLSYQSSSPLSTLTIPLFGLIIY